MSSSVEAQVLAGIASAPVIPEPFEHSIIDRIFPEDFVRLIQEHWPVETEFAPLEESGRLQSPPKQRGRRRVVFLSNEGMSRVEPIRRQFWLEQFYSWLSSPAFCETIVDKYRAVLGSRLESGVKIVADGLIVSDRTDYAIGPHTDNPRRLVSLLFYLPPDESLAQFGTSFYRPNVPGFTCDGGPHYPFDGFSRVKTVEFLPNRLVMFPKSDRCFHGVEEVTLLNAERRLVIFDLQISPHFKKVFVSNRKSETATDREAVPSYTRANPSPRYRELLALYQRMHREGERFLGIAPEDTFPGQSLVPHLQAIKAIIEETGTLTVLDYGAGKGTQYRPRRIRFPDEQGEWESVADYWDVDNVTCYDPSFPPFSAMPEGRFDGVLSTDVLEHCPEEDLPWIVEEIFSYARKFVFLTIAGYPARKCLANGENAHCTVRSLGWWVKLLESVARRHPQVKWAVRYYDAGATFVEFGGLAGAAS